MEIFIALGIGFITFIGTFVFDFVEAAYTTEGDDEDDADYVLSMLSRDFNVAVFVSFISYLVLKVFNG